MTKSLDIAMPLSPARKALRAAFVARLVRRMRHTGVMAALFSASFDQSVDTVSPPHPCASGAHAELKPLCRSGVAAGGAGGGGPGYMRSELDNVEAATVLPLAA